MISRRVTKDELQRTEELFCIAFEFKAANEPVLGSNDTRFATFNDNGDMMAFLCSPSEQMLYDGGAVKSSCIGAVSTLPQYRRGGALKGAFLKALENSYNCGDDFSCLFPFSSTYYRKFGYDYVIAKNVHTVSLKAISFYDAGGSFHLNENGSMLCEIKEVYSNFACKYNFMFAREQDKYFEKELKNNPSKDGRYTYVYKDKHGEAKSCFMFEKEKTDNGFDMKCGFLWFKDSEGLMAILSFAKSFETYYNNLVFSMPQNVDLQHYIAEWALYPMSTSSFRFGMVRVINVQSVLQKSKYIGSGVVLIEIIDNQISQNNAVFELIFKNGSAVSVNKTNKTADIKMPINVFSRFISGAENADSLLMYNDVEILNSYALNQIFYKKANFISNDF